MFLSDSPVADGGPVPLVLRHSKDEAGVAVARHGSCFECLTTNQEVPHRERDRAPAAYLCHHVDVEARGAALQAVGGAATGRRVSVERALHDHALPRRGEGGDEQRLHVGFRAEQT